MKHVLHSLAYCIDYLRDQVADLSPEQLTAQPNGIANHPVWVIGHLTYSFQAIGGEIGVKEWLTEEWARLFGTGSIPVSDANLYADKTTMLAALEDAHARIKQAVDQLDETELAQPFPDEQYREILPTVAHGLTQVLVAHVAYHNGQLSIWRRAMGMPSMNKPFM